MEEQVEQAFELMQAHDLSLIRGDNTWHCGRFELRHDQTGFEGLSGGWYVSDLDPIKAIQKAADIVERMKESDRIQLQEQGDNLTQ